MDGPLKVKFCPRCQQQALLTATACAHCGHQFRTRFTEEGQVLPPPAQAPPVPDPSHLPVAAAVAAAAAAAAVAPPSAPAVPPPGSNPVLDECTDQYRAINMWFMVGLAILFTLPISGLFLFLPGFLAFLLVGVAGISVFGIIGLALLIYGLIQRPALRRHVAATGVNAREWARPLDRPLFFLIKLGVAVWILGFALLLTLGTTAYRRIQQQQYEELRLRQQQQQHPYRGYYN